eukprot:Em0007g306a
MIFLAAIVLSLLVVSRAETTLNPQQLLDAHLNYRAKVAPPASNMQPMTWDSQLAAKAQGYAQKCIWGHNPDRTSPLGKTGENIYMTTGSPSDCSVAVTSWNNEKDYYNYDTNVCQTGKMCGHYTQLVWALSNKVGCGAFRCSKLTGSTATNAFLVVCNYFPADILVETCRRAHIWVKVVVGNNLSRDQGKKTRPADILLPNWFLGRTASSDVFITSPLNPVILLEAGVSATAAAQATESRKHHANDPKCSDLGWECVPMVVETYGAWGKEATAIISSVASRLATSMCRPNPLIN